VRAVSIALVIWFVAVVLFDIVALGAASLLSSGYASRVLIISVIVNPVDAIRTAALLATSGSTAFGSASLAFLRFTKGTLGAAIALCASIVFWTIAPAFVATRRLKARDL
jgi:Cu-processing system permease protein